MTDLVADRVQVEQRLRRVLAWSVAGVDDGHAAHRGRAPRGALLVVAQHDDVGVAADDADRVLDGLALGRRRELARVVGAHRAAAEPQHRSLERQSRACRRLVEQRGHQLALQPAGVAMRLALHVVREHEELLEQRARELLALDDVTQSRTDRHRLPPSRHHRAGLKGGRGFRGSLSATVDRANDEPSCASHGHDRGRLLPLLPALANAPS